MPKVSKAAALRSRVLDCLDANKPPRELKIDTTILNRCVQACIKFQKLFRFFICKYSSCRDSNKLPDIVMCGQEVPAIPKYPK